MAYFISCSGAKACLGRVATESSSISNLKVFAGLNDARIELIKLLSIDLDWSKTLPAYKLYTGKVYNQISIQNWEKERTDVNIVSALFGIVKHNEYLPDYNVIMSERIPGTRDMVSDFWRSQNLNQFVNNESDVDLLFSKYRKAFNPNGLNIGIIPNVIWKDKYGSHKGRWLNEQLTLL